MAEIFEAIMVICFGISWPTSIIKSLRAKTTKGKSLLFMIMIFIGYLFGIAAKLYSHNISYVFVFYIINAIMVGTDICLYFRNKALDSVESNRK